MPSRRRSFAWGGCRVLKAGRMGRPCTVILSGGTPIFSARLLRANAGRSSYRAIIEKSIRGHPEPVCRWRPPSQQVCRSAAPCKRWLRSYERSSHVVDTKLRPSSLKFAQCFWCMIVGVASARRVIWVGTKQRSTSGWNQRLWHVVRSVTTVANATAFCWPRLRLGPHIISTFQVQQQVQRYF